MNYTEKLKRQNDVYAIVVGFLVMTVLLLTWGLNNKYQDNEYLAQELNKTQKEKAMLIDRLSQYEDAEGK